MNSAVWLGTLLMLLFWGVWGVVAKLAIREIGQQMILWAQTAVILLFPVYIFLFKDTLPLKNQPAAIGLSLLAGALGVGGSITLYLTLRIAPASIAVSLSALYPVVTVILSFVFLREQVTPQQWLGIVLALISIILLSVDFSQLWARPG